MATIKFQDYIIEESLYYSNPEFRQPSSEGELVVEDSFNAEVGINGDGMGYVRIKTSLGNFDDIEKIENIPFSLIVSIRGIFEYILDEDESDEQVKVLLGSNALAILYPYLRSYITFITSQSNQYPAYILPVVNFVEMIKTEGKVNFVGFSTKMEE